MGRINHIFPNKGTRTEQNLAEDLINEAAKLRGQQLYYIPRKIVNLDKILGEDQLSEFKTAYPIVGYLDEIDHFSGAGGFLQKFGYYMEEQATFIVPRREWESSVGRYGETIIPSRPCEGDLVWFPVPGKIFEIKFVEHQGEGVSGFYQLNKLYVYRLKCELFTYSSEKFNTGIDEVDEYALAQTFDVLAQKMLGENGESIVNEDGTGVIPDGLPVKTTQVFDKTESINEEADPIIDDIEKNPFADF